MGGEPLNAGDRAVVAVVRLDLDDMSLGRSLHDEQIVAIDHLRLKGNPRCVGSRLTVTTPSVLPRSLPKKGRHWSIEVDADRPTDDGGRT